MLLWPGSRSRPVSVEIGDGRRTDAIQPLEPVASPWRGCVCQPLSATLGPWAHILNFGVAAKGAVSHRINRCGCGADALSRTRGVRREAECRLGTVPPENHKPIGRRSWYQRDKRGQRGGRLSVRESE